MKWRFMQRVERFIVMLSQHAEDGEHEVFTLKGLVKVMDLLIF